MVQVRVVINAIVDVDIEDLIYDGIEAYLDNMTVSELASDGDITITEE